MRFRQLDQITELRPGVEITACHTLADHAYFRDHFPNFPVVPGVLMLEAMFQACAWLVRKTDDFAHAVVVLKEARNVKFAGFVRPGQTLTISAEIKKRLPHLTTLSAEGRAGGAVVTSARLVLEHYNLAERHPVRAATDAYLRKHLRSQFDVLQAHSPRNACVVPTHFRWMWIDRFTEFVRNRRAVAIKTVSIVDEPIDRYSPAFPVMPCSLIVEGFAQCGGILVGACHDFEKHIVLAKVGKSVFHRPAVPGDTLVYTTEIESLQPEGAMVHGVSRIDDQLHGEVDLFFAYVDERTIDAAPIGPADYLTVLRAYGLFEVARREDGSPLEVPQRMADAERAALA